MNSTMSSNTTVANSTREEYIGKAKERLDALNAKLATLEARAGKASGEVKKQMDAELEAIKKSRQAAQEKVKALSSASDAAWDDLKAGAEAAWQSLSKSVEQAGKRFGS